MKEALRSTADAPNVIRTGLGHSGFDWLDGSARY